VPVFEFNATNNQFAGRHGLLWDRTTNATAAFDNFKVTTEAFTSLPPGTRCEAQLSNWRFLTGSSADPVMAFYVGPQQASSLRDGRTGRHDDVAQLELAHVIACSSLLSSRARTVMVRTGCAGLIG